MSEAPVETELLTREEMDAVIDALAEERAESERYDRAAGRGPGDGRRSARGRGSGTQALSRTLEAFAARHGRKLSLAHQRRIQTCLLSSNEMRGRELAELLLPIDRMVSFELREGEAPGWLLFGRPHFFTLLGLACGARPDEPLPAVPRRAYTRIEERFLRSFAEDVLEELGAAWSPALPERPRVLGIEDVARLHDRADELLLVASFDVVGLADVCRLRIVLPRERSEIAASEPMHAVASGPRDVLEPAILDMPVNVQVEIGSAEVPLARVAGLRPGDVIPISPADALGLVVRVEGAPKFRAQSGSVGSALAIEVMDRL